MTASTVMTRDGVRLYVREAGRGADVAVIPNGHYLYGDVKRVANGRRAVFYDLRNRGRSESIADAEKLRGGVHQDVDDLEDVIRATAATARVALIAHSYVGVTAVLYATKYVDRLDRIVLIGSVPPTPARSYSTPPERAVREAMSEIAVLQTRRAEFGAREYCERVWAVLRPIYVVDSRLADKIKWGHCHLKNERHFHAYWTQHVFPSLQQVDLTAERLERLTLPVLLIHGVRDRSAPYEGAREWASRLPNARLLTMPDVAHAPWIEAPEQTFRCITKFLQGQWPDEAK